MLKKSGWTIILPNVTEYFCRDGDHTIRFIWIKKRKEKENKNNKKHAHMVIPLVWTVEHFTDDQLTKNENGAQEISKNIYS